MERKKPSHTIRDLIAKYGTTIHADKVGFFTKRGVGISLSKQKEEGDFTKLFGRNYSHSQVARESGYSTLPKFLGQNSLLAVSTLGNEIIISYVNQPTEMQLRKVESLFNQKGKRDSTIVNQSSGFSKRIKNATYEDVLNFFEKGKK